MTIEKKAAEVSEPQATAPPWQVRWKRPKWDRVVVGMNNTDGDSSDSECSSCGDAAGERVSAATRTGNGDKSSAIDESWIPVSCSSVALTRKEAHTAILELHRRGKLLRAQRRRKRKKKKKDTATRESKDHGTSDEVGALSTNGEEKPTPRNKNTKALGSKASQVRSHVPYSGNPPTGKNKDLQTTTAKSTADAAPNAPKSPPTKSSISSPSTWFKSITSPGGYRKSKAKSTSGKPPLATSKPSHTTNNPKSPSSPTIFSTFNLTTPPPPPNANTNDDEDDCSSPPNMVMDASTASSLLWEDMTLTSVSEEDAAAIRLFGNQRQVMAGKTTSHDGSGADNNGEGAGRMANLKGDLGGGRCYYDHHGRVRLSDWDGFDNVVLSVTIFATNVGSLSASKNDATTASLGGTFQNTANLSTTRPTFGEVVVMELLSTKDPPLSADSVVNNPSTAAAAYKPKRESFTPNIKMTRSSSNSSLTTPSSTSAPPLPPPSPLPSHSNAGGSTSASGEDDSTTNSTTMNTGQTNTQPSQLQQPNLLSNVVDEDDETEAPNHTRVIARRVLWWPSCILVQRNVDDPNSRSDDKCPSFVSLGRTSIWKERKSCDDGELAGELSHDVREEVHDGDECCDGLQQHNCNDVQVEYHNQKHSAIHGNSGIHGQKHSSSMQFSTDRAERAADAMEAFRSLNFLFGGCDPPPAVSKKKPTPARSNGNEPKTPKNGDNLNNVDSATDRGNGGKMTQPLSMCLVTGDGQVHFFYALRVFLSDKSSKVAAPKISLGLSSSFAAFLLGPELFTEVNESVMPLSHPRTSMRLSSQLVVSSSTVKGSAGKKEQNPSGNGYDAPGNTDPISWEKILRHDNISDADDADLKITPTADELNDASPGNNWSSLGVFDASIDPSSLRLRTLRQSNVLTGTCITSDTSNSYLAICGKGLRCVFHKDKRQRCHMLGGFVTFVSLRHCAEARTIYLPFAPESIQPIYWSRMHFVVLLGEVGSPSTSVLATEKSSYAGMKRKSRRWPYAMAVRVDCKGGDDGFPSDFLLDIDSERTLSDQKKVEPENFDSVFMSAIGSSSKRSATNESRINIAYPSRFQTVAINLPSIDESLGSLSRLFPKECPLDSIQSNAIAISSIPSSPPGIILSFQYHSSRCNLVVVVNHTVLPFQSDVNPTDGLTDGVGKPRSLLTLVRPGHRLVFDSGLEACSTASSKSGMDKILPNRHVWCVGGQGWSLVGIQWTNQTYFICWDGATDHTCPFTLRLHHEMKNTSFCFASGVMPLMTHVKSTEKLTESCHRTVTKFPSATKPRYSLRSFLHQDETDGVFPSSKRSLSITLKESIKMAADLEGGLDDILVNALDSISSPHYQSPESRAKSMSGGRGNRPKIAMSHKEKSKRLLRQCSSWTQLDDTKANRGIVHGQVIVATIRLGTQFHSLTLRTNTIANPISTPFNQVLSWLCQRRDYYTAASVALSLLDDAEAVYELCGILKSTEEEFIHHKGLLDGIKPLSHNSDHGNVSGTLTSLADMAVGCLIKGGASMSKTLEGYLSRNTRYNAPRACLMLVGATSSAASKEPAQNLKSNKNDNIMDKLLIVESPSEDLIWPVRCLIKMAVVRNCLPSAILMLNATIPNELRWRAPLSRGLASAPRPSLSLFLALVDIILESTEKATRLFLNMVDEESGPSSYWFSVTDDTKLALCLISIRGKHVMLQEPEVRAWVLGRLKEEIESPSDSAYNVEGSLLPDGWLKGVVIGAFYNAECDIGLGLDAMSMTNSIRKHGSLDHEEVVCYRQDMICVQDLLVPQKNSCGLDFDLVIASLLILARRGCDWREGTQISTQTLLNTVCDMAGRKRNVEPRYIFDGATVMRQCALSDNLQAAAFLVGGKKGLVLECADLVVSNMSMAMKDAEIALHLGSLVDLKRTVTPIYNRMIQKQEHEFTPNVSHKHLMWLLEEHVLNVHTYGEFDSSSHTGNVNPVYAGRVCFRAWYCLTHPSTQCSSAEWLEGWMRRKLELTEGKSPRRLACAALVRTLLWADEAEELDLSDGDDEPLLAAVMEFDVRFMAELAQACCGLIQSIPPHLAEELMSSVGGSNNMFSLEAPLLKSVQ